MVRDDAGGTSRRAVEGRDGGTCRGKGTEASLVVSLEVKEERCRGAVIGAVARGGGAKRRVGAR